MMAYEALNAALELRNWSKRDLAAQLGEHPTYVLRMAKGTMDVPPGVLPWLKEINKPLAKTPHLSSLEGKASSMTAAELEELRTLLRWPRVVLAERIGVSVPTLRGYLEGRTPVPQSLAIWMKLLAAPLLAKPVPDGWLRHVEVRPAETPGGRPIERTMADSPRKAVQEAARAKQEAARAEAAEKRAKARQERRQRALALRQEGASFPKIGAALGISHQAAEKLVKAAEQQAHAA